MQLIGAISLVVRDYDEAKAWYVEKLGFAEIEDTPLADGKRWVLVAPDGSSETQLLLAQAASVGQDAVIGNQAGGRVFLFLHTDDFWRDYNAYRTRGVKFVEEPRDEPYATVVVFEDLYGNRWDLLQRKS
jgi:lactoylglutathione lyase